MGLFSERYGYTTPSDVIIREQITPEIESAICNCFQILRNEMFNIEISHNCYSALERDVWMYFLNQKLTEYNYHQRIIDLYIEDEDISWFYKLDLIDYILAYLIKYSNYKSINKSFVLNLNSNFERLNFAYRIIDNKVVEITSKEEIVTIEEALFNNEDNIKSHLSKALELYALKPEGDYCNSIKESISAVEAYCREKTGENKLGDALKKLEKVGIVIPYVLRTAFDKLYTYTNQPTTGIRHALMDSSGTYVPKAEEALFMLVSCSAFINYLNKKK